MKTRISTPAALAILLLAQSAALAQQRDGGSRPGGSTPRQRPNILWITSEDNGPHLGCYGDTYATTPHLDAFARSALRYRHAWSNAPVCAPARTAIITGMYPTSIGAEHMRSMVPLPEEMMLLPELLRAAGYYCTNNSKEDYNLAPRAKAWDESSPRAHWKKRPAGQPFFAVFNHTVTHESQVRARPHAPVHDPALAPLPTYHPDAPEVRRDWAQYYDKMTEMDRLAGENLRELEAAGLAEETIVFYFADHGPGMPRSKRWPYNSGLRVPLIVRIPERFRHLRPADYTAGGESGRLVSFVDLVPTLLSLAGAAPPNYLQGRAFLGENTPPANEFLHGFRGRMDERIDMARSTRDGRYVYVRQYLPHLTYGEHVAYMFQTPTTKVWKQLFDEGRLTPEQSHFWRPKPAEELYDLESDPDEVHNLAESPAHRAALERLRAAMHDHLLAIRDVGFLPEGEMHRRAGDRNPFDMARDEATYPLERILRAAEAASSRDSDLRAAELLSDADSAVRYWGAMGLLIRAAPGDVERELLRHALEDESWNVRIAAAEALAHAGDEHDLETALDVLIAGANVSTHGLYVAIASLNAIDRLDEKARSREDAIRQLPVADPSIPSRNAGYLADLVAAILSDWTN